MNFPKLPIYDTLKKNEFKEWLDNDNFHVSKGWKWLKDKITDKERKQNKS